MKNFASCLYRWIVLITLRNATTRPNLLGMSIGLSTSHAGQPWPNTQTKTTLRTTSVGNGHMYASRAGDTAPKSPITRLLSPELYQAGDHRMRDPGVSRGGRGTTR